MLYLIKVIFFTVNTGSDLPSTLYSLDYSGYILPKITETTGVV